MRRLAMILSLFCIGMFAGCPAQQAKNGQTTGPEQEEAAPAPSQAAQQNSVVPAKPDVTTNDVQQKVGEAASAIGQLAEQKTTEALKAARAEFDDAKKKVSALKQDLGKVQGTAREQSERALQKLDQQLAEADTKLDKLGHASGEALTAAKDDLQKAMTDLQNAYEQARAEFEKAKAANNESAPAGKDNSGQKEPKPNES